MIIIMETFLKIIDDKFPLGHILLKTSDRHTVKVSNSSMPNVKQNIDGHNKAKLS